MTAVNEIGTRWARGALVAAGLLALAGGASLPGQAGRSDAGPCRPPQLDRGYVERIERTLRAKQDVWGNELLAAPQGPTYEGVRRHLAPMLYAGAPGRTSATESGVYYLALGQPGGSSGADTVALHLADGSQILSNDIRGSRLTIEVGERGGERYGDCLARLDMPRLVDGWLPILGTVYSDSVGVRYDQESFVARIPQTRSLVSFVKITADAQKASASAELRLTLSQQGLTGAAGRVIRGNSTYLFYGAGGVFDGSSVVYSIPAGSTRSLYAARLVTPSRSALLAIGPATYGTARRSAIEYWTRRLAEGAQIDVPERLVMDARRNLLVQNLTLTWRYSIGNPYEEFSFPEGVDVAQVMSAQGFTDVARAILQTSLTRPVGPYPNWKMGQKLVGSALYSGLSMDSGYIDRATPVLRGYVDVLGSQITANPRGILGRERYSSDIADPVYGLHSQAVVWQGLLAIGRVWAQSGRTALAARCRSLAGRLEKGLRRALRESERRLPDGSLFVPVRLLDHEPGYDALTTSRAGSYWNLVAPYAFASGLFPPGSPEANGAIRYLLLHGSRILGLVRAGAFALYGRRPTYPESGTDQVYGLNVARFLADNDRPDQLVLSLYGQLGAAMSEGTFISGEAVSIAPIEGRYNRTTYLPPNGASNGTFLETLRLMLVHETRGRDGTPVGLEIAYATPRAWLAPGKSITVRRLPTTFGPISYTIESTGRAVHVSLDVPQRLPVHGLGLRLRLPEGDRIESVLVDGRRATGFTGSETIPLPSQAAHLDVVARVGRR